MKKQSGFVFTTLFTALLFSSSGSLCAQNHYTVSNAHAHNDYVHPLPFYMAYAAGFGSIEADVFLVDSQLLVAHKQEDIQKDRSLQSLYLEPLQRKILGNHGHAYGDTTKQLLLLIDLKTEALPTLDAVIHLLKTYPSLINCPELKMVITGNQPEVTALTSYPSWIYFDGHLDVDYDKNTLQKIALFSDNFTHYSKWKGEGSVPEEDNEKIKAVVLKAHSLHKPIRFWASPDNPFTWEQMMKWKVDYINTDKIAEITDWFER